MITIEVLRQRGFKRYYRDEVYRKVISEDSVKEKIYLTFVNFGDSYTWFTNSLQQFTGVKTIEKLDTILNAFEQDVESRKDLNMLKRNFLYLIGTKFTRNGRCGLSEWTGIIKDFRIDYVDINNYKINILSNNNVHYDLDDINILETRER